MRRQIFAVLTMSAALVLGASGVAQATDCIIPSRSDQGDASAGAHSQVWVTLEVADFVQSPDFAVEFPGVDPTCFLNYWLSHGGPSSFTTRTNKVIGDGSANPNLANGVGLDHIDEAYGPLAGAAAAACS